ncbi:MAG: N-acetylglucosamine-6-phosphate deacetylase [Kiritimatiellae bacterium]|nr:N-acetylglucosamine-6-phosphate deacetylase [Kiritimatiellia bacterium]
MKTLIKNARIISPDIDINNASVQIEDKLITRIYLPDESLPHADSVIDVKGKMLLPGFIDIHVHGRSGYDFCDGTVEAIDNMARKKLEDGVTSFLGTTLTVSEAQLTATFHAAAEYAGRNDQASARITGVHLEGPFFNSKCVGAQNPEFLRLPDIGLVKRLHSIFPVKKVSYSIELEGALDFTRQLVDMGIMPSCAHSAAKYSDFKKVWALGLRHMTHFCNVMTPLHHLEVGLVGGGLLHKDVFIEMICDKIHLCPEMIQLLFEIKGTDKIMLVTDAMRAAGMSDGEYDIGGMTASVKNGCARLSSGVVAGSTLLYYRGLHNVHEITGLPLKELVKTTSWNQARSLGLERLGKIETGYIADIIICDNDFSPSLVFVDGRQVFVR